MSRPISVSEDDWRARDDAETLKRCGEIRNDPDRYSRAKQVAISNVNSILTSLGKDTTPDSPPVSTRGMRNPATIRRL